MCADGDRVCGNTCRDTMTSTAPSSIPAKVSCSHSLGRRPGNCAIVSLRKTMAREKERERAGRFRSTWIAGGCETGAGSPIRTHSRSSMKHEVKASPRRRCLRVYVSRTLALVFFSSFAAPVFFFASRVLLFPVYTSVFLYAQGHARPTCSFCIAERRLCASERRGWWDFPSGRMSACLCVMICA